MITSAVNFIALLSFVISLALSTHTAFATGNSFKGSILEVALFMRTKLGVPVVVDPSLLNEKMLGKTFRIESTDSESALSSLRSATQAEGLSVTKVGPNHWISLVSDEADDVDSKTAELILGARSYGTLISQLRKHLQGHDKTNNFLAIANLIADQEHQFTQNRRDIKTFTDRIKGVDFQLRQAVSGSALSEPDPARARSLTMQKEALQREVIQKQGSMLTAIVKALNSEPPELLNVRDSLPSVAYLKLYCDYLAQAFANYKLYSDASSAFGFDTSSDELEWVANVQESLKNFRSAINDDISNYQTLLGQAGLAGTVNTSAPNSTMALDAALQLFDVHGDRRQAVRRVIGEKIIILLDEQIRLFNSDASLFSELKPRSASLYLLSDDSKKQFKQISGDETTTVALDPFDPNDDGRVGAVTALVAGATDGATQTLSVEIETKSADIKDSQPTIDNIFGDAKKQVSLHAADDRALVDMNFRAAIKDSLDLIASRYAADLYDSSVSIAFDSTTNINVGGDSAGVALGLATLSRVKEIPLDRKVAVTGSVRRYGDVRPVGGVYHKSKAAFDEQCLALLLPAQNIENIFYLQPKDILNCHVFAVSNFGQAAGVAQVGDEKDNSTASSAIRLYNFALLSAIDGRLGDALALSEAANKVAPYHFSSRLMAMLLRVAEVKPESSPQLSAFIDSSLALKSAASQRGVSADKEKGLSNTKKASSSTPDTQSILDQVLHNYTAEGITGSEAITKLAQELRSLTGKPVNIVVKNREKTSLATTEMNLSTSDTPASEVLRMICALGDADYALEGDLIVGSSRDLL